MNKYVEFVNDEDFLQAVKHVRNAIHDALRFEQSMKDAIDSGDVFRSDLFSNAIDPFNMQFGMALSNEMVWLETEIRRQLNKTFEQKIGEFHQKLLGSIEGWVDLGVGDEDEIDLKNNVNTHFIELKNKHNTCNSGALETVRNKLIKALERYPLAKAYWAFIIPNTQKKQGTKLWEKRGTATNERLYKTWGSDVYKLVTGDGENLYKTFENIPKALKDLNEDEPLDSLENIGQRILDNARPVLDDIKEQVFGNSLVDGD